jgi:hypothetical protein
MGSGGRRAAVCAIVLAACWPTPVRAQRLTYRGFADAGLLFYPRTAPNDDARVVADAIARIEPTWNVRPGIRIGASFEARTDTHQMSGAGIRYWDRTRRRPSLAVRTLVLTLSKGLFTLDAGKQFVRWGQSDIISPTDYFTPRDYLITATTDVLAVTAARLTVGNDRDALELVYAPRPTPSRAPLLDQRWVGLGATAFGRPLVDAGTRFPSAAQFGARYRRTGRVEYSVSFFQGPHHLPLLDARPRLQDGALLVSRTHPEVRGWGADLAATVPGVTLKAEAAWLQARDRDADDYGLWVIQAERQQGEWLAIGGYVGEWVTAERGRLRFAADRGLARSVIGRASRGFDDNSTFAIEGVARQNGDGFYLKTEYSRPWRSGVRLTFQAVAIGGADDDFLGQYRRNSLGGARARWSF